MARTKRTVVQIDMGTYQRVKDYSAVTFIPQARIIDKAINHYLDTVGKQTLAALAKVKK